MQQDNSMVKADSANIEELDELVQPSPKVKLLNTGKAGMESVDVKTASAIILNASKGSNFYARQQEKQREVDRKIDEMRNQLSRLTQEQIRQGRHKMDRLAEQLERQRNLNRVIVHIDMDAFYAAVEMRDDPSLMTIPMAVGGSQMLCTSNYHARKFGVRAAMPGFIAKKLCPSLLIVPCNFEKYTRVSGEVKQIIASYDPNYCSAGLDEAYLDITHLVDAMHESSGQRPSVDVDGRTGDQRKTREDIANEIVNEIRLKITEKTSLTASAGIAVNKMLAKICSDKNKPNGQFLLDFNRHTIMKFVKDMPISKVCGIGNVTEQLLNAFYVRTASDLWERRDTLAALFSEISAEHFLRISLGLGSTTVPSEDSRKSISVERTFKDTSDSNELRRRCEKLCRMLSEDLKNEHTVGKTLTLKLKTSTFHVKTRAKSLQCHTSNVDSINMVAQSLLEHEMKFNSTAADSASIKLRLMGVRMSSLLDESELVGRQRIKQFTLDEFMKNGNQVPAHVERRGETCITEIEQSEDIHDSKAIQTKGSNEIVSDWICPVCQRTVKVGDVEEDEKKVVAFNKHIDNCLNRKAVKEVLESDEDQYRTKLKRMARSKNAQSGGSKRFKLNDAGTSGTTTIDKFLTSSSNASLT